MTSMSKVVMAVAALALATGAYAELEQVTFCQRYTSILYSNAGGITSANEVSLISAIVDRALNGNTTTTANGLAVRGILNSPIQRPFFLSPTNFTNPTNAGPLVAHLKSFFTVAFGCKEVTTPGSFSSDLKTLHANMNITAAVWTDFVMEIESTLRSFGVIEADITYAGVVLAQFAYGAAGNNQICNFAGDCPRATTLGAFIAGLTEVQPTQRAWVDASSITTTPSLTDNVVEITVGGYVHWDYLAASHSVVQTDSSFALLTGGWSSEQGLATYTRQFTVAGDYYFKCGNPNHPTMTGTIRVTTGSGGHASASFSSSIGVVIAAIAAVVVAKRL